MPDTTIDLAKKLLLQAFVEYIDWDGDAGAPYALTIGTKREADPYDLIEAPDVTYPIVTVQVEPGPAQRFGQQTERIFNVKVSVICHIAVSEQPETELEELTGQVIENIMQSRTSEYQWAGLSWVCDVTYQQQPSDNQLDRVLRMRGVDQDADGGTFVASQTDFAVYTYEVMDWS